MISTRYSKCYLLDYVFEEIRKITLWYKKSLILVIFLCKQYRGKTEVDLTTGASLVFMLCMHLGDNSIHYFHFGRYIVGYTRQPRGDKA